MKIQDNISIGRNMQIQYKCEIRAIHISAIGENKYDIFINQLQKNCRRTASSLHRCRRTQNTIVRGICFAQRQTNNLMHTEKGLPQRLSREKERLYPPDVFR